MRREIAKELELAIQSLLPLLLKYGEGKIDHQVILLNEIIQIINSDMEENKKDDLIKDMSRSIFPVRGGLTDFYVWDSDESIRIKINQSISDLINKIWDLMR
ncbi:hypothetical protein [Xylocopilactobacillus apicola]|uniref:Uncharacterized protein n=1 Tax=Xylocopilactobacillus apicola TaxID=2932184 RepID=A0AAU9DAG0_9LACO|nr:hypothetical protein [Xylocopilactobacillus apicola]BDR59375.1 hypothetical protein XA3_18160 [Xylocopilactobacillus apicola]